MKHSTIIYAVIGCILGTTLVTSDVTSEVFDETPKCMPPKEGIDLMVGCYKTVTGKDFDPSTTKSSDVTTDIKIKIALCVAQTLGFVSSDGKTFNVDQAITIMNMLEADDATKTALNSDVAACGTKGGDGLTFVTCIHNAFMKDCK